MSETKTEPTTRVRLQHVHTLKDGWRLSETTVEWSGPGAVPWGLVKEELSNAHTAGLDEAQERNQADREAAS